MPAPLARRARSALWSPWASLSGVVKYRAFISYSHADEAAAGRLHRALEAYRLPRALIGRDGKHGPVPAKLAPVFRDREELSAAGSLAADLQAALKDSLVLLVLCSPNAAKSHWVNEEIKLFKRLHGAERVLALIVDGEPGAAAKGRPEAECFPEALRFQVDAEGAVTTTPAEPIAADARKQGDGWRPAFLKLVAGLAGVGLDAIVQREAQRRVRNLTWIAGAAVGLSGVMAFVANFALDQRAAAVKARGQAEDIISYMLTDLKDKVESTGRSDVLQGLSKEVLKYYDAQDFKRLNPEAVGRWNEFLLLAGQVDQTQGNLEVARATYVEAAKRSAAQLKRDPQNPKRMYDHAQAVFYLGSIDWQRGERAEAESRMREYLSLAQSMVSMDARNPDYQAELGYAYSNLGTLLLEARRWDEALALFEKSRARNAAFVKAAPHDAKLLNDYAQDYSWIARAHESAGRFLAAREALSNELSIYASILARTKDAGAAGREVTARNNLARLYLSEGRVLAAEESFKTAARAGDALIATDPKNTFWIRTSAAAQLGLASVAFYLNHDSRAHLSRARELSDRLIAQDPKITAWAAQSASIYLLQSEVSRRAGDDASAVAFVEKASAALSAVPASTAGDYIFSLTAARVWLAKGDLAGATSDQTARSYWEKGLAMFGDDLAPLSPAEDLVAVGLLKRLGRLREASKLTNELKWLGFQHPEFQAATRAFGGQSD